MDAFPHLPGSLKKRLDRWVQTTDDRFLTCDEARNEIIRALAEFRKDLDLQELNDVINFLTFRAVFMPFEPGHIEMDLGHQIQRHLEKMFAAPTHSPEEQQYILQLPAVVAAVRTELQRIAAAYAAPVPP